MCELLSRLLINIYVNLLTQSIDDQCISKEAYTPDNDEERAAMKNLQLTCYLNLAAAFQAQEQWGGSIAACNAALEINPNSVSLLVIMSYWLLYLLADWLTD